METQSFNSSIQIDWREQAKALFFIDHLGIKEISILIRKSRETVSRYITECEGYQDEMAFRKVQSAENRKEYQRNWDRSNRSQRYSNTAISKDTIKREHEIAVKVLSSERY